MATRGNKEYLCIYPKPCRVKRKNGICENPDMRARMHGAACKSNLVLLSYSADKMFGANLTGRGPLGIKVLRLSDDFWSFCLRDKSPTA